MVNRPTQVQNENPFVSIFFNILLPVIVLEQLTRRAGENGPTIALVVALTFPIGYGLVDFIRNGHKNYVSLLGVVNVLMTGGLALMKLEGIWFAVKEAAFPFILGLGVLASTFTRRPLMKALAVNSNVLNMPLIESRLKETGKETDFDSHIKKSTYFLTVSFFLSSALNFGLARFVFSDIDPALAPLERSSVLNDQIARMTWLSFVVIVLPLMIFMVFIMWHLISGIRRLTGLSLEEILPPKH